MTSVSLLAKDPRILPARFYSRDTVTVARDLLGKLLRVRDGKVWRSGFIVEDEAYLRNDPACHAFKGETKRNQSMFKEPGTAYVYRIHQVYCLNAVTRPGEAVLLRALQPLENVQAQTTGPGRLCKALGVTREEHDGSSLTGSLGLQIVNADGLGQFDVGVSKRIGISKAKDEPYRFYVQDNRFLSR